MTGLLAVESLHDRADCYGLMEEQMTSGMTRMGDGCGDQWGDQAEIRRRSGGAVESREHAIASVVTIREER
jgi:hypothetical protein